MYLNFACNFSFFWHVYLLVHHVYCTNVAKTTLFACLSSKASSAVVEVWYQSFRNSLCRLEVTAAELRFVGTFRQPRSDFAPSPYWLGARGIAPSSQRLWVHLLDSRIKLTLRHKTESTWSSLEIQWIFAILLSLFVIRNFRVQPHLANCWRGTWSEKGWEPLH